MIKTILDLEISLKDKSGWNWADYVIEAYYIDHINKGLVYRAFYIEYK